MVADKIKTARILGALSQQELAEKVGVSKQMISKYEKGLAIPNSSILLNLSKTLNVKTDYFFSIDKFNFENISFRKKSKLSVKKLNAIKEEVKLKLANYLEIESILQINNSIQKSFIQHKIASTSDIEKLVLQIRKDWKIGLDPVHNIIQLLEDQKIKVIEIQEDEKLFDGLSIIVDDKFPVIVINKSFGIERKRFTLLHELGHLIMNLPNSEAKEEEKFCHQFASEFLLPTFSLQSEFGVNRISLALQELVEVQKKYGISIPAIFYRLYKANIISENKMRQFFIQLNSDKNLRATINKERFATPEFSNRYEQLVYRALAQDLISYSKAASLLHLNVNQIMEKAFV